MSNNIGVLTVAFKAERFIEANIKQFKKFNLQHVVVCGKKSWRGDLPNDNTGKLARDNGAYVLEVDFGIDAAQRNMGLALLNGMGIDWALVVDADEFWTEHNIRTLLADIDCMEYTKKGVDVITAPNMHVYWKTWNHRIFPDPQQDNPVVAIRTNIKFDWSRLPYKFNRSAETSAEFHHLSYVRNDREAYEKMLISEHAHEISPDWYKNVWLKWKDGDTNLHPVIPEIFAETKYNPVPDEIKELF